MFIARSGFLSLVMILTIRSSTFTFANFINSLISPFSPLYKYLKGRILDKKQQKTKRIHFLSRSLSKIHRSATWPTAQASGSGLLQVSFVSLRLQRIKIHDR
jgi:hypothetical protein